MVNLFDVLEQVNVAKRITVEKEFETSGVFFTFRELTSEEMAAVMETMAAFPLPDVDTSDASKIAEQVEKKINLHNIADNMRAMAAIATQVLEFKDLVLGWRGLTLERIYKLAHREPDFEPERASEEYAFQPDACERVLVTFAKGNPTFKMFLATSALAASNVRETEKKT